MKFENPINLQPSEAALALLQHFEQGPDGGFAPVIYRCPAGEKTIGWGHVVRSGESFKQPISAGEADALWRRDLIRFADGVRFGARVPLTQSMFDALCCFAFNVGMGELLGSKLLLLLNESSYAGAADEFLRWNQATNPKTGKNEVMADLTRRREAERELFLRDGVPG